MTVPVQPLGAQRDAQQEAQQDVSWFLTVSPWEIERWRSAIGSALGEWQASREAVELARLGVSELLANVAKHTVGRRCGLRVLRVGADVVVQVFDVAGVAGVADAGLVFGGRAGVVAVAGDG